MCTPQIIRDLRATADDAPRSGRRAFLRAAGAAGALGVAAPAIPARAANGAVVDLTHALSARTPTWPGVPPFSMVPVAWEAAGGFDQNLLAYWEHTGTHLDAPTHRRGAQSTDMLAARDLVAPLVVIDISARAGSDADAAVTPDDIAAWETRHGRIPERAFVAMYSGWERRLEAPGAFLNLDDQGVPHAPGFAAETAEFLVRERAIVGAGVDTLSLDRAADPDFGAHTEILDSGRYGVELLVNLAAVPPAGGTVVVGAPKHVGGTGGPCRVLALT
ncbi:cyclase family protein [Nocardia grenadensis]|uniref:cyclase family protein n=1 Tax=Nocardia grenadensis TaxID=931537 RepID=UPI0007A37B03|nr:cyclase family protein [Nocardia grenadensis]